MKQRAIRLLKVGGCILLLGFIYAIFCSITGLGIPCLYYKTTGFLCPGCGITRMCISLINFKFKEAFYFNPALFILFPIYLVIGIVQIFRYIRYGKCASGKYLTIWYYLTIVILVGFTIYRNMI